MEVNSHPASLLLTSSVKDAFDMSDSDDCQSEDEVFSHEDEVIIKKRKYSY